jgi:Holliday junction resolvasome RuvABC endonuclease subunit
MKKNRLLSIGHPDKILAIDASTNSMAFSIFIDKKLHKYGKINFHGNHVYEKAGDACKKLIPFLKDFDIDAVVIESAIYTNSQKTAMNLALVQGAIIGSVQMYNLRPVLSCSPVAWQNWIGNKKLSKDEKLKIRQENPGEHSFSWYKQKEREFRKQRTINWVNINFDTNIDDDDVADAVAIGWYSSNNWFKLAEEPKNVDKAQG